MIRLSVADIASLHDDLVRQTGGAAGIRDERLLEAAAYAPYQGYGGYSAYPTIAEKAARLCYGLIKGRAFVDGNKRIGMHAMFVLLALNNYELSYEWEDAHAIAMGVASGSRGYDDILNWVLSHHQP